MPPDTETPTPLEIPQAAVKAMIETGDVPMREYVRAISAPVVSAELRRLAAQEFSGNVSSHVRFALRARADELDDGTA